MSLQSPDIAERLHQYLNELVDQSRLCEESRCALRETCLALLNQCCPHTPTEGFWVERMIAAQWQAADCDRMEAEIGESGVSSERKLRLMDKASRRRILAQEAFRRALKAFHATRRAHRQEAPQPTVRVPRPAPRAVDLDALLRQATPKYIM